MVVSRNQEIGNIHRRNTVQGGLRKGLTRVLASALLLAGAMFVPGCLVTGAAIVVVHVIRSARGETATVELDASPRAVYAAMLQIVDADPDIVLEDKDDGEMTVSVSHGEETASGWVKLMENGYTELTVKAKSPEGREASSGLALRATTRICEKLGVPYKLVEK